jgi:hypothetical protein
MNPITHNPTSTRCNIAVLLEKSRLPEKVNPTQLGAIHPRHQRAKARI